VHGQVAIAGTHHCKAGKMLKTRILTALIAIPFVFICVFYGGWVFSLMIFAISFFCLKEYLSICSKYNPHKKTALIAGSLLFIFFAVPKVTWNAVLLMEFFTPLAKFINVRDVIFIFRDLSVWSVAIPLVFFIIEVLGKNTEHGVSRIAVSFLGTFFIPITLANMVFLRELSSGMQIILVLFFTVWILDTAAYAFGRMYGKHKLVPNISPKKTVEGAIAGIVFGIISAVIFGSLIFSVFSVLKAALIGLMIAIVGQFSDLAESLMKRDADVKDSGSTIPGHGGFLDRFDSYLFAAPVLYWMLTFFWGYK
jgi:phosphatidate cytidylyltransferase